MWSHSINWDSLCCKRWRFVFWVFWVSARCQFPEICNLFMKSGKHDVGTRHLLFSRCLWWPPPFSGELKRTCSLPSILSIPRIRRQERICVLASDASSPNLRQQIDLRKANLQLGRSLAEVQSWDFEDPKHPVPTVLNKTCWISGSLRDQACPCSPSRLDFWCRKLRRCWHRSRSWWNRHGMWQTSDMGFLFHGKNRILSILSPWITLKMLCNYGPGHATQTSPWMQG